MIYILVCAVLASGFVVLAELLGRMADHTGLTDRLFRLFDLPAEKESAPNAATSEGTIRKYSNISLTEKERNVK